VAQAVVFLASPQGVAGGPGVNVNTSFRWSTLSKPLYGKCCGRLIARPAHHRSKHPPFQPEPGLLAWHHQQR